MSTKSERTFRFETLQLHVGQEQADPATDARAVPIYQTSSYVFHDCQDAAGRFALSAGGNIYGRLTNPTEDVFERRMAALEGGSAALAVASGAAAIAYTFQNLAKQGEHIVAAKNIYGGTYNFLAHTFPDFGVSTTFVDPFDEKQLEGAIQDNTKAVFLETLGNPNSDVVDIEGIARIAHAHKIPLVVDNTFATPYLVRPIEYGADIVVHSATKFIGGHGTAIGGVIVEGGAFDWEASGRFPSLTEPNESYHGVSFTKAAGAAADFDPPARPDRLALLEELSPLLASCGRTLYVPEHCPVAGATILLCTALSGGTLEDRLTQAVDQYGAEHLALDLQRLAMDFPLPCPGGQGTALTLPQLEALAAGRPTFYSDALCARYFTLTRQGQTHFVLFDDARTLRRKLELARQLGIRDALVMLPEVEDLLEPLFAGER